MKRHLTEAQPPSGMMLASFEQAWAPTL